MSESEEYINWLVIDDQPQKMIVDSVHDEENGLRILLRDPLDTDESRLLQVLFDPYISYRNMDESYRVRTIDDHPGKLKNTFYIVKNSIWLRWLHEESKNIYSDRDIMHYAIFTVSDCIDILSDYPPEMSWTKKQN